MSINYAILDEVTLGPFLELEDGGKIVTYNTTGVTTARNARTDISASEGKHYFEAIVYTLQGETIASDTAFVGIVSDGAANNQHVGNDSDTFAYCLGSGKCYDSGSTVATITTAPLKAVIGLALDLDNSELNIYVNNALVYTFTGLTPGNIYLPAFTVAGANAYGFKIFTNFGAQAFEGVVPDGYRAGMYTTDLPFSTMRFGSEDWVSPIDADEPNLVYYGDIADANGFSITRGIGFWPSEPAAVSTSYAELTLKNPRTKVNGKLVGAGRYDELVMNTPVDSRVVIRLIDRQNPSAAPVPIAVALVDDCFQNTVSTCSLKLKDVQTLLDLPIQDKFALPYTPEGTAGRPLLISLGAVRNVEPLLIDDVNRIYYIHDDRLTQIGSIRDRGDKLDPLASPPDWTVTNDQKGFQLQVEAVGKVTVDASSAGEPTIVGSPEIDILLPFGDMDTDVGGMPEEWYMVSLFQATAAFNNSSGNGRLRFVASGISALNPRVTWDIRFRDLVNDQTNWLTVKKGCYYRLKYTYPMAGWTTNIGLDQFAAGWYVRGIGGINGVAGGVNTIPTAGTYTVDFRSTCDGTLIFFGNGLIDPANNGGSTGPWRLDVDDVSCVLKSADVIDAMGGYGNFSDNTMPAWGTKLNVGCSVAHGTISSSGYSNLGAMVHTIASGSPKYIERYNNSNLFPDRVYRVAFSMLGSTFNAKVEAFAWDNITDELFALGTFTGASGNCECFAEVSVDCLLVLRSSSTNAAAATVKISQVRAMDVTDQQNESATNVPLNGITLHDYCKEIIEKRARLGASAWVAQDAIDIDDETGYIFGVSVRDTITGSAMLKAPLDSFTSSFTTDEEGRIRIVRLRAPELADDSEIVLEVGRHNCRELPLPARDLAKGLTPRVGGARNWSVHNDSDFVDDIDPATGIDLGTRTKFKRVSQILRTSSKKLHASYSSVRNAGIKDLLLDLPEDLQAEIDYVCGLYPGPRMFYTFTVDYQNAPPQVRPGSIIRVTWNAWGLDGGKKLMAVKVAHFPVSKTFNIIGWG